MFNKDFFPTPEIVSMEMLMHIDVSGKVILEPSAGKGDLATAISQAGAKQIDVVEIDSKLQQILQRNYRVIGSDFLELQPHNVSHIDCIIGNPPFSQDEKHILHAWNIAPDGCEILMLCNWNTLNNRYSKERQEIGRLAEMYGKKLNMGECFSTAERKTDVTVGMIYIRKPGNRTSEFDGFFMEPDETEHQSNGIMQYNVVRDVVNRYVEACRIFEHQIQMGIQMSNVLSSFFDSKIAFKATKDNHHVLYSDFKKDIQKSAWNYVIDKMNLNKYSTAGLKEDINKFVEKQTQVPFTMRNIYRMIEMVICTASSRMDKAIIEVFDKLTMHYDENRWNVEGWKTNSHYLVNRKFIMPQISTFGWHGDLKIRSYERWSNYGLVEDMTKALCYITGTNYDDIQRLDNHVSSTNPKWGEWFEWSFFTIRCYKKGTCHMKFKDEDVWAIFNREVARIKGYPLPEAIKKK